MRTMWFVTVFLMLFSTLACLCIADDCAQCRDQDYCYVKCALNNGKPSLTGYCTHDPYSVSGQYPYKKCLPSLVSVDPWPYNFTQIWRDKNGDGVVGGNEVLFDADHVQSIASEALADWQNICSVYDNSHCSSCPMRISYVTRESDVTKQGYNSSTVFGWMNSTFSGSPCKVDCITISMNVTPTYMGVSLDGSDTDGELKITDDHRYSVKPFYTEDQNAFGEIALQNINLATRQSVALMLGLPFQGPNQSCGSSCNGFYTGCMYNFGINDVSYTINSKHPTGSDLCMFKLLYCCGSATNVESKEEESVVIFCNGRLVVRSPKDDAYMADFLEPNFRESAIYDILGRKIGLVNSVNKASTRIELNVDECSYGSILFLDMVYVDGSHKMIKLVMW